jgi:hypothetical protein
MAIDKIIPQYLNKDEDERLVKPIEMTDALNVRVSHEANGEQGIVKNVKGNTKIDPRTTADTIPSLGVNRVIGSIGSDAGKCVYYFLFNSKGGHGIYKYSTSLDKYEKVYQNNALNFSGDSFIKADIVFDKNGDHLLYFTDDRNEPRKINATRALNGGYNDNINSAANSIVDKYITTCKQPPQTPITFAFSTDESVRQNNLKENIFQFAYQYVYDDGEVSAISMYSKLALSSLHFAFNAPQRDFGAAINNVLTLTLTNSDGPVSKIRILARKGNETFFYRIGEVKNQVGHGTQEFVFKNDGIYTAVSSEEVNKMFDGVPRLSRAQTFTNNRLVYGNYLEGFDNLEDTSVHAYPVHQRFPDNLEQSGNIVRGQVLNLSFDTDGPVDSTFYTSSFKEPTGGGLFGDRLIAFDGIGGYTFQQAGNLGPANNTGDVENPTYLNGEEAGVTMFNQGAGTTVEMDLSALSFADLDEMSYNLGFTIDAKEIAIAAIHPTSPNLSSSANKFDLPATLNGITYNLNLLDNGNLQGVFPDPEVLVGGSGGGILGLKPVDGWEYTASGIINATDVASAAAIIGNALVGQTADVRVESLNTRSEYWTEVNGAHFNGSPFTPSSASGGTSIDRRIRLWFDGFLSFTIENFSFNSQTNKLLLEVRMTDINLEANGATVRDLGTGGFAQINNVNSQCVINSELTNALGQHVVDSTHANNVIYHALRKFDVKNAFLDFNNDVDRKTFKAGASHELGIVYYDHRNRCGGVQAIQSIEVPHFGQAARSGNNGRTTMDMRITHEPPVWATKWAPVYSKNTSYERFLHCTVAEACLPNAKSFIDILSPGASDTDKERAVTDAGIASSDEAILLSLRGLEGKPNSYKDGKGALIDYKFQEGDIIRVLEYQDEQGILQRPLSEFRVLGYKYYADDENNPVELVDATTGGSTAENNSRNRYRRTGFFLIVQDNGTPGFSRLSVGKGDTYFSQRCLIEIATPKKNLEEKVYYEIGQQYDVINNLSGAGNQIGRFHQGDRSNLVSPSFSIDVLDNDRFFSQEELFLGDRCIKGGSTASGHFFIAGKIEEQNGGFTYILHDSNLFVDGVVSTTLTSVTIGTAELLHGVINIDEGDAYLKTREQLVNVLENFTPAASSLILKRNHTKPQDATYEKFIVESSRVSDFFDSEITDIGRPHLEAPEQQEIRRTSSVTYSEPFVLDSARLNLSSFNPSLFPFNDYSPNNGSIQFLEDMDESMLMIQEKKCALIPFERTLIQSASDGQLVTSQQVLGKEMYYAGGYGCSRNPESVVKRFGKVFFSDVESGKVIEIQGNKITPISDNKLESYFESKFSDYTNNRAVFKLPCGIDPENNEFIVTMTKFTPKTISIGGEEFSGTVPDWVAATTDFTVDIKPSKAGENDGQLTWDKEVIKWDYTGLGPVISSHLVWENAHRGVIILDNIKEKGSAIVDRQDITKGKSFLIDVTSKDGRFRGTANFDPMSGNVQLGDKFLDSDSAGDGSNYQADDTVTVTSLTEVAGDTVAYGTTKGFWLTRYSFIPEHYEYVHNRFFSFNDGDMYRHNVNATRNKFYDVNAESFVHVVSKANPSMIKAFNALSLEGNTGSDGNSHWSLALSTSKHTAGIGNADFDEREGLYYKRIPRGTVTAGDSSGENNIVLGEVASNDGATVTFKTRISDLPFSIDTTAAQVFKVDGDNLVNIMSSGTARVQSVDGRKVLTLSATPDNLSADDILVQTEQASISGDQLRDYYLAITLRSSSTSAVELYAVNVVYVPSPLDNSVNNTRE